MLNPAKERRAKAQISALEAPLDCYRLDVGEYPSTEQGLDALLQAPNDPATSAHWTGPYVEDAVPPDPWGHRYRYAYPGIHNEDQPDVWSLGPDGINGTEDDIVSWEEAE